jgi:hypothetical protein
MLKPEDDSFHRGSTDPWWNESAWFSFMAPERELSGFAYMYHRPNMSYSIGAIGIWDPTGDQDHDCLFYDWSEPSPLSADADMYRFALHNGLSVECIEPLRSFQITYRGGEQFYGGAGCDLQLRYDGILPPHDSGTPDGQTEWSVGHYEQPGRMRGEITLHGERIEIDCYSLRDHSWGPRKLVNNTRGHFPWAIASETSGFAMWARSDLDPADDPVHGTTETVVGGWYLRDGVYGNVSEGIVQVDERGPDGRPLSVVTEATDHLGRRLTAHGRTRNNLHWRGYPWLSMWWGQTLWTFDGQQAFGEQQDFVPVQLRRKVARSLLAAR